MAQPPRAGATARSLRALMDVLLVLVALIVLRMFIGFFGALAASIGGTTYLSLTRHLTFPILGSWSVPSPYGGVFSVDAAVLVVLLLGAEWLLAIASSKAAAKEAEEG